jgi:hypothetical protein
VDDSDWSIPVLVDPRRGALDLKKIGRLRSPCTPSVNDLISASGSISDGPKRKGWERLTSARFPATGGEVAARYSTPAMLR